MSPHVEDTVAQAAADARDPRAHRRLTILVTVGLAACVLLFVFAAVQAIQAESLKDQVSSLSPAQTETYSYPDGSVWTCQRNTGSPDTAPTYTCTETTKPTIVLGAHR